MQLKVLYDALLLELPSSLIDSAVSAFARHLDNTISENNCQVKMTLAGILQTVSDSLALRPCQQPEFVQVSGFKLLAGTMEACESLPMAFLPRLVSGLPELITHHNVSAKNGFAMHS